MSLYQVIVAAEDTASPDNPFVNAFYYDVDDLLPSSAIALNLAEQFSAIVLDTAAGIPSVLHSATVFQSVTVTSPFNPTVLGIDLVNIAGQRVGTAMPKFVSWGFQSPRTRADIRKGFKRFGRITEGDTSGDVPTVGALALLNTLAGVMSTGIPVEDGVSSFTARPVIVKRIPYITESGSTAYRLPNSPTEYQFSIAENWAYQAITTQNSRKS